MCFTSKWPSRIHCSYPKRYILLLIFFGVLKQFSGVYHGERAAEPAICQISVILAQQAPQQDVKVRLAWPSAVCRGGSQGCVRLSVCMRAWCSRRLGVQNGVLALLNSYLLLHE